VGTGSSYPNSIFVNGQNGSPNPNFSTSFQDSDSYSRVAKAAAMMASRYAHAKQFKRHQRKLRILRSRLGRIIRDIRRKIEGRPVLEEAFGLPPGRAAQIRSEQQRQRGWKL
jgi:IS5 family transposase